MSRKIKCFFKQRNEDNPVVDFKKNTIGNVSFTRDQIGGFIIQFDNEIDVNKIGLLMCAMQDDNSTPLHYTYSPEPISKTIYLSIFDVNGTRCDNVGMNNGTYLLIEYFN
ncbi:MAG: hypothetical protein NTZ59_02365 [Bacteroidetes bacterium]|nr:hypothetical protein [Bacteroidota bacterium]